MLIHRYFLSISFLWGNGVCATVPPFLLVDILATLWYDYI